jgi:nucleotide-binding universal stress UspA family protein
VERILASVDDSERSDAVIRQAAALALAFDADLEVVHAVLVPTRIRSATAAEESDPMEERAAIAEAAAAKARTYGAPRVTHRVVSGDVGPAICAAAEEGDADLIVMGSRGHGPVLGAILGSVTQHVTAHATCSVLVAR